MFKQNICMISLEKSTEYDPNAISFEGDLDIHHEVKFKVISKHSSCILCVS